MLTFSTDNIRSRLDSMPMAVMAVSLIIGIVIAQAWSVPSLLWVVLLILSILLSLWRGRAIIVAILAMGALLYNIRSYDSLPQGVEQRMVMRITDDGADYGRFATHTAEVLQCSGKRCRAKVRVTTDSLTRVGCGDIVVVRAAVRPFLPQNSSYARSMTRQGFSGRITINEHRVLQHRPANRVRLHSWAVKRLSTLLPQSTGRDVAISLSLGAKMINSNQIRDKYSYSGVSHLLAVSGLHVGMVAMLLNLILLPLGFMWRGNVVRSSIVVLLIWLYVALCGYPTSAIRAAIMFSVLQLSHLTRSRYSQENSICTAAFVMLALSPTMLFELSFSLSFIAVLAIIFVGQPINSMLRFRGAAKPIMDGIVISTVCVLATMPLISNSFGVISTLSIFVTPLALISAQIIIISSLLALIAPQPVAQIVLQAAEWCADVQNRVVAWSVEQGIGFAEVRISDTTTAILYAAMTLLILTLLGFKENKK